MGWTVGRLARFPSLGWCPVRLDRARRPSWRRYHRNARQSPRSVSGVARLRSRVDGTTSAATFGPVGCGFRLGLPARLPFHPLGWAGQLDSWRCFRRRASVLTAGTECGHLDTPHWQRLRGILSSICPALHHFGIQSPALGVLPLRRKRGHVVVRL